MNSIVHIPATYRFRSDAEREADAAAANQPKATVTEPPPEETPADLDGALDALDAELRKLDGLITKQAEFPATIAGIDTKLKELENQDLSTLEALESRQAQQGKWSNMRVLADDQVKKNKAAIGAQQATVIKIGEQAASLFQKFWWELHHEAHVQAESEFRRLFYRSYESQDLLSQYKPLVLLQFLKFPDLYTSSVDLKITRLRQLRVSAEKLKTFSEMSFQEVSARLDEIDRESRERAQQVRKIGSLAGLQ
jgi:hypothetical protein